MVFFGFNVDSILLFEIGSTLVFLLCFFFTFSGAF